MPAEQAWHGTKKCPVNGAKLPKANRIAGKPCPFCGNTVGAYIEASGAEAALASSSAQSGESLHDDNPKTTARRPSIPIIISGAFLGIIILGVLFGSLGRAGGGTQIRNATSDVNGTLLGTAWIGSGAYALHDAAKAYNASQDFTAYAARVSIPGAEDLCLYWYSGGQTPGDGLTIGDSLTRQLSRWGSAVTTGSQADDTVRASKSTPEGRAAIAAVDCHANDGDVSADSLDFSVDDNRGGIDAAAPNLGLVGHWPLDEGTGTTTADVSGNGYLGMLVNGPMWTSDVALDFDGIDDYVDVGALDVVGNAMTISAWFNAEDLANCTARDCRIVSKAAGGVQELHHYFMVGTIESGTDTLLRFRLKTGTVTTTLIATFGTLSENKWTHVAAVYGGSTMRLYKDGAEVGTRNQTGTIATDPTVSVWIGGNPSGATHRPWAGQIDDVRIYNRALTPQEIQTLATGP